jgi:hypothetical protein
MYVSNFDICPWKLPRSKEEILSETEAMLARCLDEQDYDLAGELLLAWPLINTCWSSSSTFAFHVLASVEDKAGFLPSPITRLEILNKLEDKNRKKYLYATAYHTAYVMGLLCSVSLQPNKTPPKHINTNMSVPGSARKILPYLSNSEENIHWQDELNRLTELERDALGGFLFNIALIRNVRRKQYGVAYELLEIGYELKLTDTALARQTAELLERLALLSSF